MKKDKVLILIVLSIIVFSIGFLSYNIITTNTKQLYTIEEKEKKYVNIKEQINLSEELHKYNATLVNDNLNISVLNTYHNTVLFSIYDTSRNDMIFDTIGIYAFDLDTKEIITIRQFNENIRIWDCIVVEDTLYYSTVKESPDKQSFTTAIVKEVIGKEPIIIDEGSTYQAQNTPSFGIVKDQVYYLLKDYSDNNDTSSVITTSLKRVINNDQSEIVWEIRNTMDKSYYVSKDEEFLQYTEMYYGQNLLSFYTYENNDSILYYIHNNELKEMRFENYNIFRASVINDFIIVSFSDTENNTNSSALIDVSKESVYDLDRCLPLTRERMYNNYLLSFLSDDYKTTLVDITMQEVTLTELVNTELSNISPTFFVLEDKSIIYVDEPYLCIIEAIQ